MSAMAYTLKCAYFVILLTCTFTYVSVVEYRQINKQFLVKALKISSITRRCHLLARYRQKHTVTTARILNINSTILSKCYFAFVSGNLFFSAYCNVYLHYGNISGLFYYLLASVLLIETIFPLVAVLLMINCNRYLISSVPLLFSNLARFSAFKIQNNSIIHDQWKSSAYLQLLHSKRKLALTAGLFGPFTANNLF